MQASLTQDSYAELLALHKGSCIVEAAKKNSMFVHFTKFTANYVVFSSYRYHSKYCIHCMKNSYLSFPKKKKLTTVNFVCWRWT